MNRPIQIIAEIGINHNGIMRNVYDLIYLAKKAGADIAKFQLYDPKKRPDINSHPYKDILLKSALSKDMLYRLNKYCKTLKIEFMCSVFDIDKVEWLEEINVERYKIGSKSLYDVELIEKILSVNKNIIVSLGMLDDRGLPDNLLKAWNRNQVDFLCCASKYPATIKDLRLKYVHFNALYSGLSDHTHGITASIVAMSRGARIIEKHFTLDNKMLGPDHKFSLTYGKLNELCIFRNEIEEILYEK